MPAIHRYTGVLYDALDIESLRGAEATRAARGWQSVRRCSACYVRRTAFRPTGSSASSKLPGRPGLPVRWRPVLEPVLADLARRELVVDLRSGAYVGLGRLDDAVRVDVVAEQPDGRRTVVSHFNKAHKGRLARALAAGRSEPDDAAGVVRVARRAGMRVEREGNRLTIVVTA